MLLLIYLKILKSDIMIIFVIYHILIIKSVSKYQFKSMWNLVRVYYHFDFANHKKYNNFIYKIQFF